MRSARSLALGAAALLVLLLAVGCGGDDGDADANVDADASADTEGPGDTDETGETDAPAEPADGDGFDCPLSAEQVSDVLGAPVEKDDATCTYLPGGNAGSVPGAGFIPQLPELCDDGFPEQSGYTEPVDGLGVDAFLKTGGGATAEIWVCGADAFVVFVDTGDSDTATATAAAEELAAAALESSG